MKVEVFTGEQRGRRDLPISRRVLESYFRPARSSGPPGPLFLLALKTQSSYVRIFRAARRSVVPL